MKKFLGDDIESLNFAEEPGKCIEHINKFVAEATRNYIKDILKNDELDHRTKFAMVNAVFFKEQWVNKLLYYLSC